MFCKLPYSNERENYSGFSSRFFSAIAGSRVNIIDNAPLGHYAVFGAAAGGTAEALGDSKFAKDAVTGAFVGMFNHNQLTINFVETSFPLSDWKKGKYTGIKN